MERWMDGGREGERKCEEEQAKREEWDDVRKKWENKRVRETIIKDVIFLTHNSGSKGSSW